MKGSRPAAPGHAELDGVHVIRYSRYTTTGGVSVHIAALNQQLARDHAVTIHQLYPLWGGERVTVPHVLEGGQGRVECTPLGGCSLGRGPGGGTAGLASAPAGRGHSPLRAVLRRIALTATLGDNAATDVLRAAAGAVGALPYLPESLPVSRHLPMVRGRARALFHLGGVFVREIERILDASSGQPVLFVNHLPAEDDGLVVTHQAALRGLPIGVVHHTGWPRGRELVMARQRRLAGRVGGVLVRGLEGFLGPCAVDLGNGIDTEFFDRAVASPRGAFRARHLEGAGERPLILAPAKISRRKRQLDLLRATHLLRAELGIPDVLVLLIGATREAEYRERVLAFIREHDLAGHVLLLGHLEPDQLRDAYADCDLGVLASELEGRPRVLLEMAAMEVPFVATDLPGARDCATEGRCGLLVPVGDPRALAHAAATLLRDPDRRRRCGRAGAAWVRANWSLPQLAERHAAFYLDILQARRRARP